MSLTPRPDRPLLCILRLSQFSRTGSSVPQVLRARKHVCACVCKMCTLRVENTALSALTLLQVAALRPWSLVPWGDRGLEDWGRLVPPCTCCTVARRGARQGETRRALSRKKKTRHDSFWKDSVFFMDCKHLPLPAPICLELPERGPLVHSWPLQRGHSQSQSVTLFRYL